MLFQRVTCGEEMLEVGGTGIDFEQFVTGIAEKMMVVIFRSHFPSRRLSGQFNRNH